MGLLGDKQVEFIEGIIFHADFVDTVSLIVAVAFVIIARRRRRRFRAATDTGFWSMTTGTDFVTGGGLFPLLALAASFFSERLLTNLVHHDHIVLPLAGISSFFAIVHMALHETGPVKTGAAEQVG
ncbi:MULTISPECIES: hypothetical protein [Caballeronia]|uniref:hypothetical protein n=1 Tax=Caballeronia TaxID=1827195 RepID=UPI001FD1E51B|nr:MULTISPECIES: hypothetical protein [Caballeronia]MDR5799100.1 hypothetical protein [Caballeronia sp. LZ001]